MCDNCLRARAGRVGRRKYRRMVSACSAYGVLVGYVNVPDAPHRGYDDTPDDSHLVVKIEEIGLPYSAQFPHHVTWHDAWEDIAQMLRNEADSAKGPTP